MQNAGAQFCKKTTPRWVRKDRQRGKHSQSSSPSGFVKTASVKGMRKVAEYESLTLEIEALKSEMSKAQAAPASIHD